MAPHRTFDRSPWLLEPGISYLNHGSFGACPEPVLEAQRVWRERMEAEPARFLDRELERHLDDARERVAAFLGADADGIAFVPNATTGVSTVLASLRFQPGDELLAGDHEYNATLNAMRAAAERDGARLVIVHVPFPIHDPSQVVEAYLEAVTPRTRFALVSQVTSPSALVMPVGAIVRELDRRGVDTMVDGAHAPGMVPVELGSLGAAYWTGDGHKWLCAPKGSGILHVRSDLRAGIRPLAVSHGANDERRDRPRYRLLFDWVGTTDPTPHLALPAAIRYVGGIHDEGWAGLMASNAAMTRRARDVLCAALGVAGARPGHDARARWHPCRCPGSPRRAPPRSGSRPSCSTRTASRSRSSTSRCRRRSPRVPARTQLLVRVSAQAYNRPTSTPPSRRRWPDGSRRRHRDRSWGGSAGGRRGARARQRPSSGIRAPVIAAAAGEARYASASAASSGVVHEAFLDDGDVSRSWSASIALTTSDVRGHAGPGGLAGERAQQDLLAPPSRSRSSRPSARGWARTARTPR